MTVTPTNVNDASKTPAQTRPGAGLVVERESVTPAAPATPTRAAATRKTVNWYEGYRSGYFC